MGMLHYLIFMNDYEAGDVRKHTNHLAGVQRTFNGGIVRDFAKEPNDESPDLEFTGQMMVEFSLTVFVKQVLV